MKTIKNTKSLRAYIRNHWLMLLIILQPVLDIIAFWTKSPNGTAAGTIRLAIMLLLPLYLLITLKERKRFILAMCAIAAVFALHFLSCMRAGYVDMRYDVAYAAKTAQMPILAVCFAYCIKNEQTRNQAYWGLFFAAVITGASLALGIITGTANVTYGEGLGVSGWVIDDLRCANSVILVVLSAFAVFCAIKSDKLFINTVVPALAALALIINGTKACYFSIFVIFIGFAVFLLLEKKIKGQEYSRRIVITMLVLAAVSAAVYPLTPVYKVRESQRAAAEKNQNENDSLINTLGVDLDSMTTEEKLANPAVFKMYEDFYYEMLWYRNPNMFDRFGTEKILLKYNMTTDAETLDNVRLIKRNYASLLRDEGNVWTRLFGLDVSDLWLTGKVDLENDWPAIGYYYGYVGLAAYAAFMLYFVYLIIRRLMRDFKTAFTTDNFILLVTFTLLVFLAQYSGSVLRRPNVSVYMSVVLGLIYYQTKIKPVNEENSLWGKRREA